MALITNTEFKTYAGITVSTYDTLITDLIAQVQAEAERWCGRTFDTATFTEKHDGFGHDAILVRAPPITSISSVSIIGDDGVATALDSDDYSFDPGASDAGRVWLIGSALYRLGLRTDGQEPVPSWGQSGGFGTKRAGVQIIYVGGYGTGAVAIPSDLKRAMYLTVAEAFALRGIGGVLVHGNGAIGSESLGAYSYTKATSEERDETYARRWGPWRRLHL